MKSILNLTFSKMYFKFNPLYRGRINLCHFILNSKFVHTLDLQVFLQAQLRCISTFFVVY